MAIFRTIAVVLLVFFAALAILSHGPSASGGNSAAISAGGYHTCALASGGGLMCWGYNDYGQVGDGTTDERLAPTWVVGFGASVGAVAAGWQHTCALTAAGGVKCWGDNNWGQLGAGSAGGESAFPVTVSGFASGARALSASGVHSCAVTNSGGARCWGWNVYGQLGDGTTDDRSVPVDVFGLSSGVVDVAAGEYHSCALTAGGGVQCWGQNNSGQLGDGTNVERHAPVSVLASGVSSIVGGGEHTCVLTLAGGVRCWGDNGGGRLGDGTEINRSTPVDVVGLGSGVAAIAAGGLHTCALTTSGGVKCWGYNSDGQLGDGTKTKRSTPADVVGLGSGVAAVATGGYHTCALMKDGGVKCWGANDDGQLGIGSRDEFSTPVDVPGIAAVTASPTLSPTPAPTATPTASPTPAATPTSTPTPTPTATPFPTEEPTPTATSASAASGDVDCDGDVDSVDALRILRHVASLPNSLPTGCGPIGP